MCYNTSHNMWHSLVVESLLGNMEAVGSILPRDAAASAPPHERSNHLRFCPVSAQNCPAQAVFAGPFATHALSSKSVIGVTIISL